MEVRDHLEATREDRPVRVLTKIRELARALEVGGVDDLNNVSSDIAESLHALRGSRQKLHTALQANEAATRLLETITRRSSVSEDKTDEPRGPVIYVPGDRPGEETPTSPPPSKKEDK
jgi:hypothetical protein